MKANSRNSEPVRPPRKPIGAYTAASVMVMEMTGPTISRAPCIAACTGGLPSSRCRWMFSTTTMASSTTRPIASTIASSVSRLMLNPIDQHQAADADQRQRNGHDRDDHRAERSQEQEDHHDHDEDRLAQGFLHLVDRRVDEFGRIVSHLHLHRWRQIAFDFRKQRADALDEVQRVALRCRLHADEDRVLAVEGDAGVGALRGEFDGGDILDPHEAAVLGLDDHALELIEFCRSVLVETLETMK